jgi:hypothetical protein
MKFSRPTEILKTEKQKERIMTNMFAVITTIIKAMIVVISIMGILIFAGWLTAGTFIAKNGKKLLARFNRNGLLHGVRNPRPPRPYHSDR